MAARMAGVPRVLGTFHVDSTYDLSGIRSGWDFRALERLSNGCLHRAIAVSEATKRDWIQRTGIPAERVLMIHNGLDPDQFRRRSDRIAARQRLGLPSEGTTILGGVGRLDEAKGFTHLLDAIARLGPQLGEFQLVLAGDGPLRRPLEEQAERLAIGDRVRFLGFQHDVQSIYDALDLFVLPSLCETLGYAHLEAMATELPCIGTRVGGVPEVIVPGETGLLVPPRDPEALARAILSLVKDPELRERMGRAGRERVIQHFHERDMVMRTINLYREMLQVGPLRRRSSDRLGKTKGAGSLRPGFPDPSSDG